MDKPLALTPSIAKDMILACPAKAYHHARRLGGRPKEQTDDMRRGKIAGQLLLGGDEKIEVFACDNWKKKADQQARAAATAAGGIATHQREYQDLQAAVEAIRVKLDKLGIAFTGQSEVTLEWTAQGYDGLDTLCRGRIDHLAVPRIYDLKTTSNAAPTACQRDVERHGYAIQAAAYLQAVEHHQPSHAGRLDFIFIFAELEAPYCVTPLCLDKEWLDVGRRQWKLACDMWAWCLKHDEWPDYVASIVTPDTPQWVGMRDQDLQLSARARRLAIEDRLEKRRRQS